MSTILTGPALISRLKAYYTLLPKGYMDTLVGMALASSTGYPPNGEWEKGHSLGGFALKAGERPGHGGGEKSPEDYRSVL